MKQQASGGITGIEMLIEDLEVDLLAVEFRLYRAMAMTFWLPQAEAALAQVEGR